MSEPVKNYFWITKRDMGNYHAHRTLAEAEHKVSENIKNGYKTETKIIHVISADYHEYKTKRLMEIIKRQDTAIRLSAGVAMIAQNKPLEELLDKTIAETTRLLEGLE